MNNFSFSPTGGAKVVFEYANRLSARGNKVQMLYLNHKAWKKYHLPESFRRWLVSKASRFSPTWYPLDKKVERLCLYDRGMKEKTADTDVFVVTAVTTVNISRKVFKDRKIAYFIQGYENWDVSDEYCQNTYKLGMTNIVISQWLKGIVDKYSKKPSILIKDPIDLNVYKINTPVSERKLHAIGVLYHAMPHKGLKYSIAAIKKLKTQYPDLEVYMFGVPERPKEFPDWIHYTRKATQQQTVEIYNKVSVWLCATIDEGYGLTGLEAMACGDALVSTAYTGALEYAEDGYNALLSPVKGVDALANNVRRVFEDDALREKLIQNAQESVKDFSWAKAVVKLEETLRE